MSMTLEQFASQLDDSGVISAEDIAAFQESQSPPVESAEDLAKLLVKHKKVTKLQAKLVFQGKGKQLQLGNYLIQDKIGSGGMGDVYLAKHSRMNRSVALKVLPAAMAEDEKTIRRFQREVQAAAKLSHPNVVTAHDADEAKGIHYLVMEYVDGTDLGAFIKKQGVLPVGQALDYILQAAKGLEYAHEEGIIHRDIKPSNMLLDKKGNVKILDMGLARIDDVDGKNSITALTNSGSVMGTVDYMSPEQAQSTHTADNRSDIYSLGCSLYYLLTGDSVYGGQTIVNRIMAHRDQPIPSLCSSQIHVPSDVDALYQKMIAKQPEDRFQSMSEVISAIENCSLIKSSSTVSSEPSDLELHKFLQSQRIVASPTIVMSADAMTAEKSLIDIQETPTSDFLNKTLGGTAFKPLPKRKKPIGKRGWIAVGTVLASLILLAGIFITVDTAEGTIVLEIDQPELAGAVVTVDDQQKITIKTGEGKELITVEADKETHTLKVTKGGFETFTKQFTVKAGGKETIKVRLVPLVVAKKTQPPETVPIMPFPMTDRQIVEWVCSIGGSVAINSGINYVSTIEELPAEPVEYYSVNLSQANFPAHDLSRLANLTNLQTLVLDSTVIRDRDLQYLKGIDTLLTLCLNNTKITGEGLRYLNEFTTLLRLEMNNTPVTNAGMEAISSLKYLSYLGMDQALLGDNSMEQIGRLKDLKVLHLNDTALSDAGMESISRLKELTRLYLANTRINNAWHHIKNLSKLHTLDLRATVIDEEGLKDIQSLKNLKSLILSSAFGVNDQGLKHIGALKGLTELYIDNTQVSNEGMVYIGELKNLVRLHIDITAVGDKGLQHISGLDNLTVLSLDGNQVTDVGLQHLHGLKKLEYLDLESTKVTPQGIADLQKALPNCKIVSDFGTKPLATKTP
ncbi:Serine/threonine-protein kinase PknB [Gimesia maris]|uniref:protein kinase domain-containing protein n=1 Tax=Gimesia maris TaxID=122 RepID=UPI0011882411|nr:protein kinase [Gimesia maris]QDU15061.1 Serine/threonine-protein kinase PknB [Gimesia maris]